MQDPEVVNDYKKVGTSEYSCPCELTINSATCTKPRKPKPDQPLTWRLTLSIKSNCICAAIYTVFAIGRGRGLF